MCPQQLDECYLAEVQMACCDEEGTNCVVRHIYSAVLNYDPLNTGNYNYVQTCRTDNRFHKPVLWCALGYMYLTILVKVSVLTQRQLQGCALVFPSVTNS